MEYLVLGFILYILVACCLNLYLDSKDAKRPKYGRATDFEQPTQKH